MARPNPRILMCRPEHFGIEYEINPWMKKEQDADRAKAILQWEGLVSLLKSVGAAVETMTPVQGLPDMVFTANAGVVFKNTFIPSRFRHPERQGESPYFENWFVGHGFKVHPLDSDCSFEGAGDALFCGDQLFAGYIFRSEIHAHQELAAILGCEVLGLELKDPYYYHLDTCFCPLAPGVAIYYPSAFDEYGLRVLKEHVPQLIECPKPDAERFGCNAVAVGKNVVLNTGADVLAKKLQEAGFITHQTELGEYLKSGGSAKCLTLRLDGEEAAPW